MELLLGLSVGLLVAFFAYHVGYKRGYWTAKDAALDETIRRQHKAVNTPAPRDVAGA